MNSDKCLGCGRCILATRKVQPEAVKCWHCQDEDTELDFTDSRRTQVIPAQTMEELVYGDEVA